MKDTFRTDFENHGMIGSGAFSDVYKVRNPDDGKFYAVKRSKNRIKNKSDRLRYLQEPKMFKRLGTSTSSNVLQYYSAWQEEGYFYTLTELCSGGNLKNLLEVSLWFSFSLLCGIFLPAFMSPFEPK